MTVLVVPTAGRPNDQYGRVPRKITSVLVQITSSPIAPDGPPAHTPTPFMSADSSTLTPVPATPTATPTTAPAPTTPGAAKLTLGQADEQEVSANRRASSPIAIRSPPPQPSDALTPATLISPTLRNHTIAAPILPSSSLLLSYKYPTSHSLLSTLNTRVVAALSDKTLYVSVRTL
jgi:hypothetical protein